MRYRDYKTFQAGQHYHVYNRGNNKQKIFINNKDYAAFLKRLRLITSTPLPQEQGDSLSLKGKLRLRPLPENSFSILAYCLMPNHFHLLIKQNTDIGVDRLISKLCTSYVSYINRSYKRVGHLSQDTFKAKVIADDSYLTYLSAYIHNNPVSPMHWAYSSLPDYVSNRNDRLVATELLLKMFGDNPIDYKKFVESYSIKDTKKKLNT